MSCAVFFSPSVLSPFSHSRFFSLLVLLRKGAVVCASPFDDARFLHDDSGAADVCCSSMVQPCAKWTVNALLRERNGAEVRPSQAARSESHSPPGVHRFPWCSMGATSGQAASASEKVLLAPAPQFVWDLQCPLHSIHSCRLLTEEVNQLLSRRREVHFSAAAVLVLKAAPSRSMAPQLQQ